MDSLNFLVTAVIINYRTADLTERAITTLRAFYPALPLLLIDNGSNDASTALLRRYQAQWPSTTTLLRNDRNRFHGPAMHQALQSIQTPYALFLDSDCEVIAGGFIERMITLAEEDGRRYAVGKVVSMDKRGFDVAQSEDSFPYIRPVCMLVRKNLYFTLSPFAHHGTPCLANMQDAVRKGYQLVDFPVFEYVNHRGRGTAGRYGYGLGLRGKLNFLLHKLGL